MREGRVVYGVTTGFGELKDRHIPPDQVRALQLNLLRSHCCRRRSARRRATWCAPCCCCARRRWRAATRACRPERGRRAARAARARRDAGRAATGLGRRFRRPGAARPPGAVLVGEGEAWLGDQRMPAALALRGAGLQPLDARGQGRAGADQRHPALDRACGTRVRGRPTRVGGGDRGGGALDRGAARLVRAGARRRAGSCGPTRARSRPRAGCAPTRADSALVESHANCGRVQDAYSLRCVPQVLGASWDAIAHVAHQLEIEFNSVNDNPLVFPDDDEVVSAGLFHAQPVGVGRRLPEDRGGRDRVAQSERRIDRLLCGTEGSGCRRCWRRVPGLESGYMMAQYTAAALVSENKVLCASGDRGFDPDRRRPRGSRQHGADRGAPRARRGREHRARRGARAACARLPGARVPPTAHRRRTAPSGSTARCGASCPRPRATVRSPSLRERSRAGCCRRRPSGSPRRCWRREPGRRRPRACALRAAPTLSCTGWVQEAALRMLMNNLDPEVAERPDDLIVYGGTGQGGALAGRRSTASSQRLRALERRRDAAGPVGQAGRRLPHAPVTRRAC